MAAPAPGTGAGLSSFLNKRRASTEPLAVEPPVASAPLPATHSPVANDSENQTSPPEPAAESLNDNRQPTSKVPMDIDPIVTNIPQEESKALESTLNNDDTDAVVPKETTDPIVAKDTTVDQELLPKVPESISPEGQEDVQDDLTATSYYSAKDTTTVAAVDEEMKPVAVSGNNFLNDRVETGKALEETTPENTEVTVEPPSAMKTMNAPRVSLSPPARLNVGHAASNPTDMDVERTNMGDIANRADRPLDNAMDSTMIDPASIGLADNAQYDMINMESYTAPNNNETVMDNNMNLDDDNSIIIPLPPGCDAGVNNQTTFPMPESTNVAQYGTDLDTSMELTAPTNGTDDLYGTDLAVGGAEKKDVPSTKSNSTSSQITGLNAYEAGDQKPTTATTNKGSLVNRSASSRIGARNVQGLNNVNKTRQPFSLARTSQRARASASAAAPKVVDRHNQPNLGTTKVATAHSYSKTVTPPGRGRNLNPNAAKAPSRPGKDGFKETNTAVTPDVTAQNRIRPSVPMPARDMQKHPAVEGLNDMSVERIAPGNDATFSPTPPSTTNHTNSTTPKMSNVQNAQPLPNEHKDTQWNLSITTPSTSNLSFDELLNQFLQDIQEAADLHEQGENEMLNLQVDLSHAMASALRYKGDMMDLLDEIGDTKANAQRVLAHFAE